ncbi:MAG TPA: histidinol dehydrogenase [Puia sp.]|jgi:histidinol dehydrogenase|nr:histidinol dehydrogenase [Puia sp.]
MQIIKYPKQIDWVKILQRPFTNGSSLEKKVRKVLNNVKKHGDTAVREYTEAFDGVQLKSFVTSKSEIAGAEKLITKDLKQAITNAKNNIEKFHAGQLRPVEIIQTMPGIQCWRKNVAIEKVGLYVPGGTAPLFSTLLMLGIPATLAGCKRIVVCSPPGKNGRLHPAILFVAHLLGIHEVYKIGGVQAIAALAYGTKTIASVNKIFGPGNQFITCAKQLVQLDGVAVDLPAGPSEVAVFADATADASFVAADLLSQAEHGPDSQVLLVCNTQSTISDTLTELAKQLEQLPRKQIAKKSLANSKIILVRNPQEAINILNEYAPEHLILSCKNAKMLAGKVINAGSVFIGHYSPESAGDYASGTNHTLPTNGFAKSYSGVSMDSFVKKITFQELSAEGLRKISKTVEVMAAAEGLQGHVNAVRARLK